MIPLGRPGQSRQQKPAELVLGPRVSDSVGVGWGLRICIPAKFPNDINATGFVPALWTLWHGES